MCSLLPVNCRKRMLCASKAKKCLVRREVNRNLLCIKFPTYDLTHQLGTWRSISRAERSSPTVDSTGARPLEDWNMTSTVWSIFTCFCAISLIESAPTWKPINATRKVHTTPTTPTTTTPSQTYTRHSPYLLPNFPSAISNGAANDGVPAVVNFRNEKFALLSGFHWQTCYATYRWASCKGLAI